MKKSKSGNMKKHRGNPHGNAPFRNEEAPFRNEPNQGKMSSDDRLREESGPGVSESERLKQ